MKAVVQYILVIILAIALIAISFINIFSTTILSKEYVLEKLKEEDFYEKIYEQTKSNFENYIYQSGLDESVISDIVTEDKVEEDTKIILNNIYNGANEQIDTQSIADNLNENIKVSLGGKIPSTQQKAIDTFVETICDEYEDSITHTKYENTINKYYNLANKYIKLANKILLITIAVSVILMILLTYRRIYRILARFGVVFTVYGLSFLTVNNFIKQKIKINGITIINSAFSNVLRNILTEILSKVFIYGIVSLVLGIILIIIFALIKSARKLKREKEKYTPED